MQYTPDPYAVQQIAELEKQIAIANSTLEYYKAWLFLDNLAHTQETNYVNYLASHYGREKTFAFYDQDAFRNQGTADFSKSVNIVKRAISSYKSSADTKKNPSWANQALKSAIIVDNYDDSRNKF